jgi:hypothetical protein
VKEDLDLIEVPRAGLLIASSRGLGLIVGAGKPGQGRMLMGSVSSSVLCPVLVVRGEREK